MLVSTLNRVWRASTGPTTPLSSDSAKGEMPDSSAGRMYLICDYAITWPFTSACRVGCGIGCAAMNSCSDIYDCY